MSVSSSWMTRLGKGSKILLGKHSLKRWAPQGLQEYFAFIGQPELRRPRGRGCWLRRISLRKIIYWSQKFADGCNVYSLRKPSIKMTHEDTKWAVDCKDRVYQPYVPGAPFAPNEKGKFADPASRNRLRRIKRYPSPQFSASEYTKCSCRE